MQPLYKRILLIAFVFLVLIQVFPGDRPEVSMENASDIHNEILIGQDISNILKNSCYDCHSNETVYPWYSSVVPVSWIVNHDIMEARSELNFSEWSTYSAKRKHHKLEEIIEEVEEGEMPMKIYTILHTEAQLTTEESTLLAAWARAEMEKINMTK